MKFSYKFLIATFLILSMVIFANVFALKYYAGKYFNQYVETIKKQTPDIDFTFLEKILSNPKIDPDLAKEYRAISKDLSNISDSLENFSKNPKTSSNINLFESLQKAGIPTDAIENIIQTNALQSFFKNITSFLSLDLSTPEGIFVFKTLRSLAVFNSILIGFILVISYLRISYSFKPIVAVIDNLSNIINKKEYKNISYKKKDEFYPLIETINGLNRSLSLQEKIRSDFLSDLSHEIKTPITAIKCYLEGIEDGIIQINEKNLTNLKLEIERLIKITNLIMEYEKEESYKMADIFITKFELANIVEFVISEYIPILTRNNQQIISYVSSNFKISADRDKFIQIIHNIFSNFIKYAGKGTSLSIKVKTLAKEHIISFIDNGKGVNPNELPFLKEKFYKIEKSRNKKTDSGIGIGLSVVQKIVTMHDGEFIIDSEPKKGFEIIIKLPR